MLQLTIGQQHCLNPGQGQHALKPGGHSLPGGTQKPPSS